MKINISNLSLAAYIVPALSSSWALSLLGLSLNEFSIKVIYGTALAVWSIYFLSSIFLRKRFRLDAPHYYGFYRVFSSLLMSIGLVAIFLNFLSVRSIPLFGGDNERVIMSNSILWNIYIVCSVGVFLSSYLPKEKKISANKVFIFLYMVSALLSGWKGTFLNTIILFMIPRYKNSVFGAQKLFIGITLLIAFLFIVNFLRSDSSEFTASFLTLINYLYWGFFNFSDISDGVRSDCLYSIPFSGCKFSFDNDLLVSSTWNVYTALMPLYVDGGLFYSLFVFSGLAFFLCFSSRFYGSLAMDYVFFMCANFLLVAHNGYFFSSKSVWVSLALMALLDIIRISKKSNKLICLRVN